MTLDRFPLILSPTPPGAATPNLPHPLHLAARSGDPLSPHPLHLAYSLILGDLTLDDLDHNLDLDDLGRDGSREESCRTSTTGGHTKKEICSTSATAGQRRSRKRVYLQQPGRVTRSKKSIAQPDASLTLKGDGLALHDDNIAMTTESDSIPRPDEDNHMDTEGDSILRPDEDNHMDTEEKKRATEAEPDYRSRRRRRDCEAESEAERRAREDCGRVARGNGLGLGLPEKKTAAEAESNCRSAEVESKPEAERRGAENGQHRSSELTELEVEKRTNAELRLIIDTKHEKMDELQRQLEETKATRIRDKEEMNKKQDEMNAKIELLLRRVETGLSFKKPDMGFEMEASYYS
ncbi:hypothetical protein GUJ93_ZPchr0010g10123 [Zizania palustris]|uniref:Uncharacterized protein n=1 Tax=Zizania palustris TaxID=103762 RepID=A0A8J6BHA0_ZIZPA|nr:hypothetical protein GUJ93_ZPchr0010g10123 [Zizania palustris]